MNGNRSLSYARLAIGEARILVKHVESLIHTLAKPIEEVCALVGTTSEAYMSAKELIDK